MSTAFEILSITGPIYLAIALGYACTRLGLFGKADMTVFGKFTLQLSLPALLFNALSQRPLGEILNGPYMAVYALGSLAVLLGGLWWARKVRGHSPSYSSMVAMGMSCPNSGFVGYPVLLLSLGPVAGVALALNMIVENFVLLPLLLAMADSERNGQRGGLASAWRALGHALRALARNPMIWGIVLGLLFAALGWSLPSAVARTVNLFAAASGALSLFVIGGALVGLQAGGLGGTVAPIALGKLVLHPLAVTAVMLWFVPVADPALQQAVVLSAAMPMLGIYTLLSQRHGHGTISAAALLLTTVLSFFTLSALLWALRQGWF